MTIDLIASPDDAHRQTILDALVAYNTQKTGVNDYRPLAVVVRDDGGREVGGLWGWTAFDWLFVELFVLPESARRQGLGTTILRKAESEAVARGCRGVWLDTYEFQARGFYEKQGYTCFGEIEDHPRGSSRYFMKKALP
jgi:GNAT superfamily N-acetyltransferase